MSFPKTSISLFVNPLFAKKLLFIFFTITDLGFEDSTFHFSVFGLKNVKFIGGIVSLPANLGTKIYSQVILPESSSLKKFFLKFSYGGN